VAIIAVALDDIHGPGSNIDRLRRDIHDLGPGFHIHGLRGDDDDSRLGDIGNTAAVTIGTAGEHQHSEGSGTNQMAKADSAKEIFKLHEDRIQQMHRGCYGAIPCW